MAVTEIVTVPINPDPANLENVEKVFPELLKYFKVPNLGILSMFRGWYVNKDGKDVRGEALEALIIEWDEPASFHSFVGSDLFKEFAGKAKPLLLGPPDLQLFATDQSPTAPANSPVVEIYRVQATDVDKIGAARKAWEAIAQSLGAKVKVVHGESLNLDDSVALGLLGWETLEERELTMKNPEFTTKLDVLRACGTLSQAIVEVDSIIL